MVVKKPRLSGPLSIHQIEPGDFEIFVEMIIEMARTLSMEDRVLITQESDDGRTRIENLRHALFGEQPLLEALIMKVGGEPAGFCTFHTSFSTFRGQPGLFLEDLFLLDRFRKLGLGKQLMAELALLAKKRGCYRLVWHVPAKDEYLHQFYLDLGGQKIAEWTMHIDENQIGELIDSIEQGGQHP
jgi:GNAT superfamily N-acetyltransferase